MLKKFGVIVLTVAFAVLIGTYDSKPIFKDYANNYEIYVESPSSNAKIISTTKNEYPFIKNKFGESCKIKNPFCLQNFLEDMKAEIVFTEQTEEGISYYAYSNAIRYKREVCKKTINLQIFIGQSGVTVGSPIIYGSF